MNPYIDVNLGGNAAKQIVRPIYQYDHGRKLRLRGLDTTKSIMIQYAFYGMTESQSVTGEIQDDILSVVIPDAMLMQDKDIMVYVYVENESSGVTTHEIRIPIIARAKPSELYTPEQIDNYGSAMLELTDAIQQIDSIKSDVEDITNRATEAVEIAEGWANATATATLLEDGNDPTVSMSEDENGNRVISFGIPAGKTGNDGGVGPSGADGEDGFSPTVDVEEIDGGHRVVITDVNGEQSFNVMDGEDGLGGGIADSVAWENITGIPDVFPPEQHKHTADEVGARADTWLPTVEEIGAAELGHIHTAEDVGARPDTWLPTADEIGARSIDWAPSLSDIDGLEDALASAGSVKTVNEEKPDENGNIEVSASDVGALATDGSGTMEAPINFETASIGANEDKLLMRKDSDGNEYAIYDEGNKPTAADIGALTVNLDGEIIDGSVVLSVNATTLNGMTFDQLKEAIMAEAVYQ